jgi:hypothetical protein
MQAGEFVRKWAASQLSERAASQSHFNDLCALLGEETPASADPSGDFYAFEYGVSKTSDGEGFADVWLNQHFGWEYKGKHKDLRGAYKQLVDYHENLGNPPLLVVCDMERFEVHTKWTNQESWTYRFRSGDVLTDEPVEVVGSAGVPVAGARRLTAIEVLKALWEEPDRLKPTRTTEQITKEAATLFDGIATTLRKYGVEDMRVARFVSRVVFCMFATDVGLLPQEAFSNLLKTQFTNAETFRSRLANLFRQMRDGGEFGSVDIRHFNGELFGDDDVPEWVTSDEILKLGKLNALNWADVEPAIFGTLFERLLDSTKQRAKLGAHYTSRHDIETLVEPVLMAPLRRRWDATKHEVEAYVESAPARAAKPLTRLARIETMLRAYQDELAGTTVLDPACGSGNFLYVSLALMKGLEKELLAYAGAHRITLHPRVHPRQLFGIELNPYAHELSSIVIWIGYLQWKHRNAIPLNDEDPILQRLDQIKLMDAIMDLSDPTNPREPEWPSVDVIVGNPPFLGGNHIREGLGDTYVDGLFGLYLGRVKPFADLCCYWYEKARALVESGDAKRVGLLATQSIRRGASLETLKRVKESGDIFFAESDRAWVLEGAAVRVSMVGFDKGSEPSHVLDRRPVRVINADLTHNTDLTTAERLRENAGLCFMGPSPKGPFDIPASTALAMLRQPNPNGRNNSEVVRPLASGTDIVGRPRGLWTIDFGLMPEEEAALFQTPYEYLLLVARPVRRENRRKSYAERWWRYAEPRPGLRNATHRLDRVIVTPSVAKHRVFAWLSATTLANQKTLVFAREDDYFLGVLHSRIHEVWSLATSSRHGKGNDPTYNNTTCFETFPFPWPPGTEPVDDPRVVEIGEAARELNELRERWLNPAALTPDPAGEGSAGALGLSESELKKRTLTNLYNERPQWLANAHRKLDGAVFAAYGWPPEMNDAEVLARLLALNLERSAGLQ